MYVMYKMYVFHENFLYIYTFSYTLYIIIHAHA